MFNIISVMRYAILSDIHGNIDAFSRVLEKINSIQLDKIYFLGDAVGYLPFCKPVLQLLRQSKIICLKGNHESMLLHDLPVTDELEKYYRLDSARGILDEEDFRFVESWPTTVSFKAGGKKYLLQHGSPLDHLTGYIYPDSDLSQFCNVEEDVIISGHTHRPFIKNFMRKTFINVGSVGLPRDVGNLSSFCIIDTSLCNYSIFRLPFSDDIVKSIRGKVHDSVLECLSRRNESFYGELI